MLAMIGLSGCHENAADGKGSARPKLVRPGAIRLMPWNIYRGKLGLDGLANVIKTEKPDIVLLQEVLRPEFAPAGVDQAADLAERIGGLRVYSLNSLRVGNVHKYGDPAILSRWPLKDVVVIDAGDGGRAYAMSATVDLPGPPLHVISVHANGTFKMEVRHVFESATARSRQIDDLIDRVKTKPGTVLIGGDFNTPEWMPEFRRMCEAWTDLGRANDPSLMTMPSNRPALRIDYVFASGAGIRAKSYRVIATEASDHCPVVVDLDVSEEF